MELLTPVHVLISLVGIAAGFAVLAGMLKAESCDRWTAVFLATTVLTSATGYLFPFHGFTPADGLGIVSLIVLTAAILARYTFHLAGPWRKVYVVTAMMALYLNVFVLFVQLFRKVPALQALAPTQSEPAFTVTQIAVLLLFVVLTAMALRRFQAARAGAAA